MTFNDNNVHLIEPGQNIQNLKLDGRHGQRRRQNRRGNQSHSRTDHSGK